MVGTLHDATSVCGIEEETQIRLLYFLGEGINKGYLPVLVPVGVIGNILSFLVGNLTSFIFLLYLVCRTIVEKYSLN